MIYLAGILSGFAGVALLLRPDGRLSIAILLVAILTALCAIYQKLDDFLFDDDEEGGSD